MDGLKLNLGAFNKCVEYVSVRHAEYPVDPGTKVSYYMSHDGDIASTDKAVHSINIPLFDVGASISIGRLSDPNNVKMLLVKIELDIFVMLKRIIKESGNEFDFELENIRIPIQLVNFFDENSFGGCYGWAEVGIAIFA